MVAEIWRTFVESRWNSLARPSPISGEMLGDVMTLGGKLGSIWRAIGEIRLNLRTFGGNWVKLEGGGFPMGEGIPDGGEI